MHVFIEWVKGFFGTIGPNNLATFVLFVAATVYALVNGKRKAGRPARGAEPLSVRLTRIEAEQAALEDRQRMSDTRLAQVEGQVGVLQRLVTSRSHED